MKPPTLCLPFLLSILAVLTVAQENPPTPLLQNANYIFNAIHASMRQFGSSIHHNGMSSFLASVPKDTKLYHGDASPDLLKKIGWMAFEPEHAMTAQQRLPADVDDEDGLPSDVAGYLHTYAAAKDLRLLYIDGTSAGKSVIGTLDSQDRILFNDTITGGVRGEDQRARTSFAWRAGFEIILCEPEMNLVSVRNGQGENVKGKEGKPRGKPAGLLRAITSRFHGIGGERVKLNYGHFVTAYNPSYALDLEAKGQRPRLQHLSSENLQPVRNNLTGLILDHDVTESAVNWQSIADLFVARYGPFLRSLSPPKPKDRHKHNIASRITSFMAPFASSSAQEIITLCATHVNYNICSTLVDDLMTYLDWTTWKECRGCRDDEFCAVPIWPQGSDTDFEHPMCRTFEEGWQGEGSYWGPVWD
ncbi:hypothetical protein BDW66DRAFT_156034 [Aspergillus desertorum]